MVGILIVFGAIAGGFAMAGGHFPVLIQPSEFVVILGAAVGILVTSSPGLMKKRVVHAIKAAMKENIPKKEDYLDLLKCQYELFMLARRQGVLEIEPIPHRAPGGIRLGGRAGRHPDRDQGDGRRLFVREGDALAPQQVAHPLRLEGKIEVGDVVGGRIALRAHLDTLDQVARAHARQLLQARKGRDRNQPAQQGPEGGLLTLIEGPILGRDGVISPGLDRIVADREDGLGPHRHREARNRPGPRPQEGGGNGQD